MTDKKKIWWIAGIVAAVAVLGIGAYLLFSGGSKPESVLLSYTDLLKKKDYKEMYSLISSDAKKKWKEEDFIARNKNIYEGIDASDFTMEIKDSTDEGDNGSEISYHFRMKSAAGTIFLDCDSSSDLMGLHSILYGHHMKNQTMFAQIVKFKDESFFRENREVILYLPESELHLRTIAAVYGDADGEKRRTEFSSRERFNRYVDEMTKNCSFRELPVGGVEGLYSFVTCSYEFNDARTILYAVRK